MEEKARPEYHVTFFLSMEAKAAQLCGLLLLLTRTKTLNKTIIDISLGKLEAAGSRLMEQDLLYTLPLGTFFSTRTKGLHVTNRKITFSLFNRMMGRISIPDFYDIVLQ